VLDLCQEKGQHPPSLPPVPGGRLAEEGEQPPSDAPNSKRGKYKTHANKEFGSHNCTAKYSFRK
jgi:hypothetical protein